MPSSTAATQDSPTPPPGSKISEAIASLPSDAEYFSLEFFPPKTAVGFQNLVPRLSRFLALSPLFVCVTFGAGGATADKSLELANVCQNHLGFRTCLHLTCTNLAREKIDWVLEECKALGVKNILALRGDEPRAEYVNGNTNGDGVNGHDVEEFRQATDLIRYIRSKHGDYFCIGAAAYPEGHPTCSAQHAQAYYQCAEEDMPFLRQKVEAGADFFITQLFYDVNAYVKFEALLDRPENESIRKVPMIPGLMPVQSWQSFTRTCKLARVTAPPPLRKRVEDYKADDEAVKTVGVNIISEIIETLQREPTRQAAAGPKGYHFFTLNLEKSVAQILERCNLLSSFDSAVTFTTADVATPQTNGNKTKRRRSSAHNRVVVSGRPSQNGEFETLEGDIVALREKPTTEDALAIAEGEGSRGREANWDEFPNGRWGDARSPAYAPVNNYVAHPNLARIPALRLWSSPTSTEDITVIFRKYLLGQLPATPWSEDDEDAESSIKPETAMIKDELLALNDKGWWTLASQPAVNAARSTDQVVGWGPRIGGFVWQKPFVEFFLPSKDWQRLKKELDSSPEDVVYFAGNANGETAAADKDSVNPVTWGCFTGKEIITPTIVEDVSFRAWQEEAFSIWAEWQRVFHPSSPTAQLLGQLRDDVWLVNVIGHDYIEGKRLWELLAA